MTSRHFPDWISAYLRYAAVTEAPKRMHFWSAVGAVAGALRRRVWIDMKRYQWYPSFYIVFTGPPGIVAKSTSIDISMRLLKQVPGIKFGADAITWQALVTEFAAASESFVFEGEEYPMSPITFAASEFGSLVDIKDGALINLLIELWDGKAAYHKVTKQNGSDTVEAPWINILAGTTPSWLASNVPQTMIGGGLSSRILFVFGEEKEKYIAYLDEHIEDSLDKTLRQNLIDDLEQISYLVGPYAITKDARDWGREWYEKFWKAAKGRASDPMMEGYGARKQTHLHKVAMVLSAARGDSLIITADDLQLANAMLEDLEKDMPRVFSKIGRTDESLNADKFIAYVRTKGKVSYEEAFRNVHTYFPNFHDFEGILRGAIQSGQLAMTSEAGGIMLSVTQRS